MVLRVSHKQGDFETFQREIMQFAPNASFAVNGYQWLSLTKNQDLLIMQLNAYYRPSHTFAADCAVLVKNGKVK